MTLELPSQVALQRLADARRLHAHPTLVARSVTHPDVNGSWYRALQMVVRLGEEWWLFVDDPDDELAVLDWVEDGNRTREAVRLQTWSLRDAATVEERDDTPLTRCGLALGSSRVRLERVVGYTFVLRDDD